MGYSVSAETRDREEKGAKAAKSVMAQHPNYRQTSPLMYESVIGFVLRSAAHLVSPPMDNDESYECECVDVAEEIRALEDQLTDAWADRDY